MSVCEVTEHAMCDHACCHLLVVSGEIGMRMCTRCFSPREDRHCGEPCSTCQLELIVRQH